MTTNNPYLTERPSADDVVAILSRELPGFAAGIHAGTDTFVVRGPILFAGQAGVAEFYATSIDPERYAAPLIERTRQDAIKALGLDALMRRELQRARHEASIAAYAEGKAAGIAEGRKQMLTEILAAKSEYQTELDEALDEVDRG